MKKKTSSGPNRFKWKKGLGSKKTNSEIWNCHLQDVEQVLPRRLVYSLTTRLINIVVQDGKFNNRLPIQCKKFDFNKIKRQKAPKKYWRQRHYKQLRQNLRCEKMLK